MKLDGFESVFRSSVKERFSFRAPSLSSALVVTDMSAYEASSLTDRVQAFLAPTVGDIRYATIGLDDFDDVPSMLEIVERERPDLIVSYRNQRLRKDLTFTLGAYLDTLTQAISTPVLVLPPPDRSDFDDLLRPLQEVMVITDHLTGDDRLVNWGVYFCADNGELFLAHVEDDEVFARYADAIGKIANIETEPAVDAIRRKLLQLPTDYIASIAEALEHQSIHERATPIVTMGHALSDYRGLIAEHDVDLLVMNAKDERQLAMHGRSYALAVEIRDLPLFLL